MPVMDEFKEEREALKNASFQEKLKYFWDYYKWHTVAIVASVIFVVTLVHDIVSQKDDAFFAVMLNSVTFDEETTEAFRLNYAEYAGIDVNEYDVLMDSTLFFNTTGSNNMVANFNELTMSASQRLLAYTAAGELDVIMGGSDIFPDHANDEMFYDLREIMTEEQVAKYEPYFYYVDQAHLDAIAEAELQLSINETLDESLLTYPDPTKPEDMEDPIPVGLFVTDSANLSETYTFTGDYTALGIMVNAPHVDNALKYIDYLFEE